MLNTKQAPLDDVHVRRAIAWAINREEIVSGVLLNNGVVPGPHFAVELGLQRQHRALQP